jgi:hypothetical protein
VLNVVDQSEGEEAAAVHNGSGAGLHRPVGPPLTFVSFGEVQGQRPRSFRRDRDGRGAAGGRRGDLVLETGRSGAAGAGIWCYTSLVQMLINRDDFGPHPSVKNRGDGRVYVDWAGGRGGEVVKN